MLAFRGCVNLVKLLAPIVAVALADKKIKHENRNQFKLLPFFFFQMHSNVRDITKSDFCVKSENVLAQPNNYTTGPNDFSLSSLDEFIQENGDLFDQPPESTLTGGPEITNPEFRNRNPEMENGSDHSE